MPSMTMTRQDEDINKRMISFCDFSSCQKLEFFCYEESFKVADWKRDRLFENVTQQEQ